jgi:hypothetical protein
MTNLFKADNIISILEKELVGKPIRLTKTEPIIETYEVVVKKSCSVTDKQFESGHPKFRMKSVKRRQIGVNEIHTDSFIKRIWFEPDDWYNCLELMAELENGQVINVEY